MGRNTAVRSQMDVRICLRVREPRDADLILGHGSLNSGWHAHKLTSPGEFLISDPEHAAPERNRAYLIDDDSRDQHAARYGHRQPAPPAPAPDVPSTAPEPPQDAAEARPLPMMTAPARKRRCGTRSWTPARTGSPSGNWQPRAAGPAGGSTTGCRNTPRRAAPPRCGAATGGPRGPQAARPPPDSDGP